MCVVYEAIILFGVIFFFGYAFSALTRFTGTEGMLRTAFQLFMFTVLGGYFSWFWSQGRWSLPMKTIGVKLVRSTKAPLPARQATIDGFETLSLARAAWRYTVASIMFWGGIALVWKSSPWWLPVLCLPFAWSLFDRRRRTLYDLLAGTMLLTVDARAIRTPGTVSQPPRRSSEG